MPDPRAVTWAGKQELGIRETAPSPTTQASDMVQATETTDILKALTKDEEIAIYKERKLAAVKCRNEALEQEIASTQERLEALRKVLKYPAQETVKAHIKLLHDYNEIRDIGQGLLGLVADGKNMTIKEVYEEFGVGIKD